MLAPWTSSVSLANSHVSLLRLPLPPFLFGHPVVWVVIFYPLLPLLLAGSFLPLVGCFRRSRPFFPLLRCLARSIPPRFAALLLPPLPPTFCFLLPGPPSPPLRASPTLFQTVQQPPNSSSSAVQLGWLLPCVLWVVSVAVGVAMLCLGKLLPNFCLWVCGSLVFGIGGGGSEHGEPYGVAAACNASLYAPPPHTHSHNTNNNNSSSSNNTYTEAHIGLQ